MVLFLHMLIWPYELEDDNRMEVPYRFGLCDCDSVRLRHAQPCVFVGCACAFRCLAGRWLCCPVTGPDACPDDRLCAELC